MAFALRFLRISRRLEWASDSFWDFFMCLYFSLTNKITIGNSNNNTVMVMGLWTNILWIVIAKNLLYVLVQYSFLFVSFVFFAFLKSSSPFVTLTRRTLNFIIFLIIIVIVIPGIYEVVYAVAVRTKKQQQLCSTFSMC